MRFLLALLLSATAAMAQVPSVVTDIPPVHSLAAAVMQDVGKPVLLLPTGASEHAFQLRPSQAQAVANADLVLWVGPELTPWLDSALQARPEGAAALELLETPGTLHRKYGALGHADEDAHGHDGTDPHAWLDPANGKVWVQAIATELSRLDPENAATYAANAAATLAAIDAADAAAAARLAPAQGRPFIAFHDAYGYFTDHYGLNLIGTLTMGDAAAPGAAHIAELQALIGQTSAPCLFPEPQHDPALLQALADDTGARIGGALDPVGSTLQPGPALYPALLTGLAATLATCLAP